MSQDLPGKILLAHENAEISSTISKLVENDLDVQIAHHPESITYLQNHNRFEVVVVNLNFMEHQGSAFSVVQKWRQHADTEQQNTGFVIISDNGSIEDEFHNLKEELGRVVLLAGPDYTREILLEHIKKVMEERESFEQQQKICSKIEGAKENIHEFTKIKETVLSDEVLCGSRELMNAIIETHEELLQFDEAIQVADKALEKRRNDILFLNAKGRIFLKMDDLASAKECFEKADKLAPRHLERMRQLVEIYVLDGESSDQQSKDKATEIIEAAKYDPDLLYTMLKKLRDIGMTEQIEKLFEGDEIASQIVRVFNNKGVYRSRDGQYDEAIRLYCMALDLLPNSPYRQKILYNLGLSKSKKGIVEKNKSEIFESKSILLEAIEIDSSYEKPIHLLSRLEKLFGAQSLVV